MTSMKSKKKLLKESPVYVIVDKEVISHKSIFDIVNKIKYLGPIIIQLRDKISKKEEILKDALLLHKLLLNTKTIFIINDYLDVAKIVNSDGIHLGQADTSIEIARHILGKDKLIGVSCHNLKQAQKAQIRQADYISIGPIFSTPTKPDYKPVGLDLIKKIKAKIRIPFFAIGGINEKNIDEVLAYGAKRVAVCSAICQTYDTVKVTQRLKKRLE